jgi:photosystem II stability/assembly factor-like uncharacterized protein
MVSWCSDISMALGRMTRSIFSVLLLLAFLTTVGLAAGAGTGAALAQARWVPLGPEGGSVRAVEVAANGRTVYAGIPAGLVWKSINRGRNWTVSSEGLSGRLLELRTAAVNPGIVYALTTDGVFASFDAARTWSVRNGLGRNTLPRLPGPGVSELRALEVAPSSPLSLYVVARPKEGELFSPIDQVYRSQDGGLSWVRATRGLPNAISPSDELFDLAVDPTRPQVVYAATTRGVWKTTDRGGRWSSAGLADHRVFLVAVDRVRPDLVYAVGSAGFDAPRRFFASEDGGRTWSERAALTAVGIEVHPTRAETAYATGFFDDARLAETTDGGRTWTPIGPGLGSADATQVQDVAVDPTRPDVLFAAVTARGTDPGLFQSGDSGGSWRPFAAGIAATRVSALAFEPGDPGSVYAGLAEDGVHRLDVATGAWTPLGLQGQAVLALAADPEAPGTFYAVALKPNGALGSGQVYVSTDGAATFQLFSDDPQLEAKLDLAVVNGKIWAAGFFLDVLDPATGLWERRFDRDTREVASAGTGPATKIWWNDTTGLDAGGGQDGLFVSNDAGINFARPINPAGEILDIALLADDPHAAFGLGATGLGTYTSGGVFLSDDAGATWRFAPVAPSAPAVHQVVLDPADPERILAGTVGAVYESMDGGASWINLSRGLPRGALITELIFDDLGRVYAATDGGGVFRLRDRRP